MDVFARVAMSAAATAQRPRSPLRWGLLGCGGVASKFAKDLSAHAFIIGAAASRDGSRAAAFASGHGIPRSHASYDALLDDPGVDAVYISLPNHLHAEWSIRASRAGKHVLCEKPAALSAADCEAMLHAAERAGTFFMEGFMYRCHPQWGLARAIVDEGAIGAVRTLRAAFCSDMGQRPGDIRLSPAAGGGALSDVGCYTLDFARRFAGAEPVGTRVSARIGPEGVDEFAEATLEFPGGVKAEIVCALREARPHLAVIEGDSGSIEILRPWHPPADGAEVKLINAEGESIYKTGDGLGLFAREALEVGENLGLRQGPSMPWEDSLGQARALEGLRREAGVG